MGSAREEILARLRGARADVPDTEEVAEHPVPRDYVRILPADLDLLVERLVDYRALVRRTDPAGLAAEVAAALAARGVKRLVVPPGLPPEWLSSAAVERVEDDGLTARALDGVDGVITACAVAIVATGTIVLDAGPGQGRRALTLVPDYHLCVVTAGQVVGSVPEAVGRLDGTRPQTWISGPSATSDIELNRVEGVHGPRTLEVLLVVG